MTSPEFRDITVLIYIKIHLGRTTAYSPFPFQSTRLFMLKNVIYIASDARSGSTLLDLILGNHSDIISIGELHHLKAYTEKDRRLYNSDHPLTCICGEDVSGCRFWNLLEKDLNKKLCDMLVKPTGSYTLNKKKFLKNAANKKGGKILIDKLVSKAVSVLPDILDSGVMRDTTMYGEISDNCYSIYNAICRTNNVRYVVDSSKHPYRFKLLYLNNNEKIKIIHLIRNPAAVVFSKMKRGMSESRAIAGWKTMEKNIARCRKNIPHERILLVRYEDLCRNPESEVRRILSFLNIPYESGILNYSAENKHHIGGSGFKFYFNGEISLDNEYLNHMSPEQIENIYKKTGVDGALGYTTQSTRNNPTGQKST